MFGSKTAAPCAKGIVEKVKALLSNLKEAFLRQITGSALTVHNFLTIFATWCFLSFEALPKEANPVFPSIPET